MCSAVKTSTIAFGVLHVPVYPIRSTAYSDGANQCPVNVTSPAGIPSGKLNTHHRHQNPPVSPGPAFSSDPLP